MSQTWVIKDTAPVDEASLTLATTNISFTTNNEKATSIGIVQDGAIVMLIYGGIAGGAQLDLGASPAFEWDNDAYKTLVFDTAPTGELLAWLQKNADEQSDPEYLTRKSELTLVADAIRAKGGTAAQLVYPAGFVSAIQAIQTGVTPQLIVTTSAGAAVTATKGSKTVSGTAGTDGTCTLELSEAGEWSVTSSLNGNSNTQTVLIGMQTVDIRLLDSVFANNSWETIIAACRSGSVPGSWVVGDSKTMTINGANYQIDIIGKSHDDYTDGSGKAPLTFQLHDCYADVKAMNSSNTNSGGWKNSAMRTTYLPAILALMPTEVQNGIREVNKLTSAGSQSATINTTEDKLFLLSEIEIFGSVNYSKRGEGTQYDYYKAGNSKVKKFNGGANDWWERSPRGSNSTGFCIVDSGGDAIYKVASGALGVAFGFCF